MCGILCLIQFGRQPCSCSQPEVIDRQEAQRCLDKLKPRGPDSQSSVYVTPGEKVEIYLGFTRLAIMDPSGLGMQPFSVKNNFIICNGEIYNYQELAQKYQITMKSHCDCEVLLPLYEKVGFHQMILNELDAEFSMVLLDMEKQMIYAARDRYGVRPLYYGYNTQTMTFGFASEMKALHPIMEFVAQVKPDYYFSIPIDREPTNILSLAIPTSYYDYNTMMIHFEIKDYDLLHHNIRQYLTAAVKKRLQSDVPLGFLLSGGLDSSLVVAIAAKILGPEKIACFSIGLDGSPDVEAAKKVVKYLGITHHHIVPFTVEQGIESLPRVIQAIESYDITTIRASVGQYLIAQYVKANTPIKVLLSGEGSDEIAAGYKYFRFAPGSGFLQQERLRLLEELYLFDNLRTDRTMAAFGLEVRVPFLDLDYVDYIVRTDPSLFRYYPTYIEKKVVRDSFSGYLPKEILYRPKEAFSDAVSSKEICWYKSVAKRAEELIDDQDLLDNPFVINKPQTKEALYYRRIFDEFYPGRDNVLPHYWLPKWVGSVTDPSATILS